MTLKGICLILIVAAAGLNAMPQSVQKGPYTVTILADGVYHIEDSNDSNPAGFHVDADGNPTGTNNCSDMYLVVGSDKALLIDLSNAVKWDTTATESLRSLVYERADGKDLFITITHRHGDHMGMLPAFAGDASAEFWIPGAEFKGLEVFPQDRTERFAENAPFDLGGGYVIRTMEVPGHTGHSTLFFLEGKDLVFTGDAIGSGSGVWLFNNESFFTYTKGIEDLIRYIEDPANKIDLDRLVIHGGHAWQRGTQEKLTSRYIYDMQTLIQRMELGIAETEGMSAAMPFLNTNFKFGTATITWNEEACARLTDSIRLASGSFALVTQPQDYGLTVTRLIVDLGEGAMVTDADLTQGTFDVLGSNLTDKGKRTITGLSVVDREGRPVRQGRYVAIDLDFGSDEGDTPTGSGIQEITGRNGSRIEDSGNGFFYVVTLNKNLGRYGRGDRFILEDGS